MQTLRDKLLTSASLLLLILTVSQACGGLITFTDRAAWRTAAGGGAGDLMENFNGFNQDADWTSTPVVAGFLTISNTGSGTTDRQRVDVFPFVVETSLDGTPFSYLKTNGAILISNYNFSSAVTAVGFDYRAGGTAVMNFETSLGNDLSITGSLTTQFFGLVYNAGETISGLSFQDSQELQFGSDDWEAYSSAAVPEPSTLTFLATCTLGTMGYGFRAGRRKLVTASDTRLGGNHS